MRIFLLSFFIFLLPSISRSQEAPDFFRQNCLNCHTIGGGRLTGPDLKDVLLRKDRAWLSRYISDPQAMISSGDAYAAGLLQAARGVVMPRVAGLDKQRIEALLDLIAAESKLEKSQFAGLQISMDPFTPQDVERGRALFLGLAHLENGGPACLSCHSVGSLPWLGGGRLGPDLSKAFERLEGRKGLSAWLFAPATSTMQPLFKNRALKGPEIHVLAAFLEQTSKAAPAEPSPARVSFLLLGLGGAVVLLTIFEFIWKFRFRDVRRPLVKAARIQEEQ